MKLDFKSIIILILLGLTLIFGYNWYLKGDDGIKEKLKELQSRYDEIEKEKEESNKRLKENAFIIDSLVLSDSINNLKISTLEFNVSEAEKRANKIAKDLGKIHRELEITRNKIKEFKENPPNRTGDDLLNSIKNKTK